MKGPGEEPRAEPSDTPERLLKVGRDLFSRGGFEGTSIRALTQAAGVNLGAVTYHFQSKKGLYSAVLEQVLGPVREGIRSLVEAPLPAPRRLSLFVHSMFHYQRENVDLPRFMVQEIVLGEQPSPPVLETVDAVVGGLARIVEEGQEEGTIVAGDSVLIALTILSQPLYLSVMPRFLNRQDLDPIGLPRPAGPPEEHVMEAIRKAFFVGEEDSP